MNQKNMEEQIIQQYQQNEQNMILVFAQWCINHDLDPIELYRTAYPNQSINQPLLQAIELTTPKEKAEDIPNQVLLDVLSLFGNDDLAFIVSETIKKNKSSIK